MTSDATLRQAFDASPAFLHVLRGPEFVFEYANSAYYRLVGRRDLIGRPAFEAMPEAAGNFPALIGGCGRNLGLPEGSSCIHTKSAFEL